MSEASDEAMRERSVNINERMNVRMSDEGKECEDECVDECRITTAIRARAEGLCAYSPCAPNFLPAVCGVFSYSVDPRCVCLQGLKCCDLVNWWLLRMKL